MGKKHCIVIGAGLAGLAAAHRAIERGWSVDVLEADKCRVGGRIFTKLQPRGDRPPLVYELGGEWIGKSHRRVIGHCKRFGLKLIDHQFSFRFWEDFHLSKSFRTGLEAFSPRSRSAFQKFSAQVRKATDPENEILDRIDWWTKLKELNFTEAELGRRDLMDSTDFGESIRHTSAFAAATEYVFSNPTDEMDMKIAGGNDLLIHKFVDFIEKRGKRVSGSQEKAVHRGCDVTRIGQKGDRVKATTSTGREFEGDACICAIPAPCLLKIDWSPHLADEQRAAAQQLQYARIMKTAVFFPEKFWPHREKTGFSLFSNRASDFCFESTFGQEGPEGIICSYAIGDKADDLAHERNSDLARWIAEDVSTALGARGRELNEEYLCHEAWQLEQWIGGAYAFYRPGQWFKVRPALAKAHGRVAFAGEHISKDWQGFMEGAVETGEAAADAL